jgi:hypothetical protein
VTKEKTKMDVSQILATLKSEKKATAARLVALTRAVKILRKLRGGETVITKTDNNYSTVAANRRRGKLAWRTRMRNQKAKLSVMKSKRAA